MSDFTQSKLADADPAAGVSSIGHTPSGKWEFDESVTNVFDDMLRRSIPQYDVMRQTVTEIAATFAEPKTHIVDLGCSRGEALAPLVDRFGACNRFVGLEISEPMLAAARKRFDGYIAAGVVEIRKHDLRKELPHYAPSVTLSILTVQFTPIEYRQRIVESVYKTLRSGGAFVFVEKILGDDAQLDDLMTALYWKTKSDHGYSQDEIERKRLSLEGVLVPVTAKWNEQMLRAAGFSRVDCFWRWMNFAGWIAIKS